jgi:hypothetical protein
MSVNFDGLSPGDYFMFVACEDHIGQHYPIGEPMMVRGVSLPWITFSPISQPFTLGAASVMVWGITIPSEEYVDAWRSHFWEVWVKYEINQRERVKAYKSLLEPQAEPQPEPQNESA